MSVRETAGAEKPQFTNHAITFFSKSLFILAAAYGAIAVTLLQVFLSSDPSMDVKLILSSNIIGTVKVGFLICVLGVIFNLYTKTEPSEVKARPIADRVTVGCALVSTFGIWYLSAFWVPSVFLGKVISNY